eukprot:gnl/MRDRNA2_/MRDRNA2_399110_c0_seq1.p1 gnl/MRDRNA2_/MRDRNA2_399110_c0~~gnl/MRDRNA2_/MRDRNA2_399110_c0_seq1.p1  ORF type:complete len:136 (-),score=8.79 gnl/MRDRNA2_/MRDRNA2_399110_c0_seq1:53-403(-)
MPWSSSLVGSVSSQSRILWSSSSCKQGGSFDRSKGFNDVYSARDAAEIQGADGINDFSVVHKLSYSQPGTIGLPIVPPEVAVTEETTVSSCRKKRAQPLSSLCTELQRHNRPIRLK